MVNAIVVVFVLILIIIVGLFALNLGNTLIDATQDFQQVLFTQIELREVVPIPQANEDVCDIRITVRGNVDQTLPLTELFVRMNPGDVSYQWFDCHPATGIPYFSLLDFGKNSNPQPLSVLFGDAPDLEMELEMKNFPNDPPVIKNKFLNPNLAKSINLPPGSFPTPHPITQEFIITNIPDRNYKLTVNLNNVDLHPNDPFETNICKQFTVTC